MNPTFRRFTKPALILAGGLLALLAFCWLALPGILQSQTEKFIAEKTGHRLTMARPEINPLAWSLRLRDLQLVDPQGDPLIAFRELLVDLSAASLARRALVFDAIGLDGLDASLIQRKAGGLNWTPLIDALKSPEPEPPSTGLPRVDIRHLRIGGARLALADQRATPALVSQIEPLDLELTDVSTLPDDAGKFMLQAKTQFGAQVAWQGDVTLNPLTSSGRLDVTDIDLERLAPLLQGGAPRATAAGVAAFGADYRLHRAGETLNLGLQRMKLSIAGLRLQPAAGEATPRLAVDGLAIDDGTFDLASGKLAVAGLRLEGNRVEAAVDNKAPVPVLTLDRIAVSDVDVDLAQRAASVATLALNGGGISARRNAEGTIDLLGLIERLKAQPAVAPAPAAPTAAAAPWRFKVGQATLAGFAVALRDDAVTPAAELGLDNIAIAVDGVSDNLKTPLPLKASIDVRTGGRLELAGTLTPADAAADLKLKLSNLALKAAQPYIAQFAALDFAGGQVSAAGRLSHSAKGSAYRGSLGVHDLRLNEAGTPNVFLAWKSLASDDLELGPRRLDVARLRLDGLDTKLIIDKDKSTNLQRVLRRNEAAPPHAQTVAANAPAPAAASAVPPATDKATPGFVVNIDQLRLRRGALDFADHSLMLPFATRIHGLRGAITGLSSKPGAPGQVELDGEVDEFGLARAFGEVDFFRPTDFMDLKVVFRNVEMTRMTPYSATFAGRKIDSGKLGLDLEYKIKNRRLEGANQVVIERLELGERVESPTAKDLPLDLAIALLSDADGRIDLGLPISGSLDDPQFSYGQIVWKAIVNVLGKLVTAPFRALGALFGGGEKLDSIAFEAGAARLTPPEREKLARLATVLNKRPALALGVHGTWTEADRVALQDLQVRRAVAAKAGQSPEDKNDPGPLSTRAPKIQGALENLFADRFGGGELAALKEGFRRANPGQLEESVAGRMMSRLTGLMREKRSLSETEVAQLKGADFHAVLFEALRAKERVGDDVLQALAVRRGEYALANLKAAGAPEARIRQGAAEKAEAVGREALLKLEAGKAGVP